MSVAALAFGGWVSAALAAGAALLGWRLLALRRECIARACHEVRGALVADSVGAWSACANVQGKRPRIGSAGETAFVAGTRYRLAQALGNLIANAIEHGGEEIVVSWFGLGATVRIEVRFDGGGLPASVSDLVERGRRAGGQRGRGLAIAAAAAGEHGGLVGSAATKRGTRIVMRLPAADGDGDATSPTEPRRHRVE